MNDASGRRGWCLVALFLWVGFSVHACRGREQIGPEPSLPRQPASAPRVASLDPPQGAARVEAGTDTLKVVFDQPMRDGWSWVMDPRSPFPEALGEPAFEADRRTHLLRVRLEPDTTYVIWLNSERHQDFQSEEGVPLEPVRWSFTTRSTP